MSLRHMVLVLLPPLAIAGCEKQAERTDVAVIYVAVDQAHAEDILRGFEQQTGIAVRAVFDTEAAKTTGLASRLSAEAEHPSADVFWNNEIAQTLALQKRGLLETYVSPRASSIPERFRDPAGQWTGLAGRARVIVYNTQRVPPAEVPTSIFELIEPKWRGRVAVANPLFGTTRTHAAALFAALGRERAETFFTKLHESGARLVDGNAVVRDLVSAGECDVGLTDTDDVHSGMLGGMPIAMVFPDRESLGTLVLPTTVSLVRGAPHSEAGRKLVDFLLSEEVEKRLAASPAGYLSLRPGIPQSTTLPRISDIRVMKTSYSEVAEALEVSTEFLRRLMVPGS